MNGKPLTLTDHNQTDNNFISISMVLIVVIGDMPDFRVFLVKTSVTKPQIHEWSWSECHRTLDSKNIQGYCENYGWKIKHLTQITP